MSPWQDGFLLFFFNITKPDTVTPCTGTASISYFRTLFSYVIAPVSFVKFPHTPIMKNNCQS